MTRGRSGWTKWQEGMKKLQSNMQDSKPQSSRVTPSTADSCQENNQSQDDLMMMLECPICLEIADSPPIYQCTEGHLLCKVGRDC